jgi:hypothetical protein
MRKASFVIGLCAILALALNVTAMQRSHPDIMKEIGAARSSLKRNIDAGNGAEAAADGVKLAALFKEIVPMYEERKLGPAVEMANESAAASAEAAEAAEAGNMADATAAHGTVVGGCRDCHSQYREKSPDGGYRFKGPQ